MIATKLRHSYRKFKHSKLALALPITFLLLFVSTLAIISFTYYFAVQRVNAQGQTLKVSTAKESLLSMDESVLSTLGQPGSSSTFDMADSGGLLRIEPTGNLLTLTVNDSSNVKQTIFNASVGRVIYELPYTPTAQTGLYLKGDSRTIISQSGATTSQLYIVNGAEHPEIHLQYRPTVTYATAGLEDGKTVNNVRIYIVNFNSSASMASQGELPLQISCINSQLSSKDYVFSESGTLAVSSALGSDAGQVSIPISSTPEGAIVHLETVVSNISIERLIR